MHLRLSAPAHLDGWTIANGNGADAFRACGLVTFSDTQSAFDLRHVTCGPCQVAIDQLLLAAIELADGPQPLAQMVSSNGEIHVVVERQAWPHAPSPAERRLSYGEWDVGEWLPMADALLLERDAARTKAHAERKP